MKTEKLFQTCMAAALLMSVLLSTACNQKTQDHNTTAAGVARNEQEEKELLENQGRFSTTLAAEHLKNLTYGVEYISSEDNCSITFVETPQKADRSANLPQMVFKTKSGASGICEIPKDPITAELSTLDYYCNNNDGGRRTLHGDLTTAVGSKGEINSFHKVLNGELTESYFDIRVLKQSLIVRWFDARQLATSPADPCERIPKTRQYFPVASIKLTQKNKEAK
jgi:hypothetical protein